MKITVRLPSYLRRFQSQRAESAAAPAGTPDPVIEEPPIAPDFVPDVMPALQSSEEHSATNKYPVSPPQDAGDPVEPAIIETLMLEAFGISDPGCVRTNNEDYYLLFRDRGLYLVADGMGGAQAGEHASKLAAETVAEYIWRSNRSDPEVLAQAFQEANRRVMEAASHDSMLEGMGTTLVAALERGPELQIASVGDSRAYVYEDGRLLVITEDQTWVHEVGRRLGLDEVSLRSHPMRHVLTMAIGVSAELRIHTYVLRPQSGTQVLLCSDGLHGVVDAQLIAQTLSQSSSLEEKCQVLIQAAKNAGGPDNITAVLLQAGNNGAQSS